MGRALRKTLGSPVLTPEAQRTLIKSVPAEVGSSSVRQLEAVRDEVLLGLLELHSNYQDRAAPS
jgi:hypothetical protein